MIDHSTVARPQAPSLGAIARGVSSSPPESAALAHAPAARVNSTISIFDLPPLKAPATDAYGYCIAGREALNAGDARAALGCLKKSTELAGSLNKADRVDIREICKASGQPQYINFSGFVYTLAVELGRLITHEQLSDPERIKAGELGIKIIQQGRRRGLEPQKSFQSAVGIIAVALTTIPEQRKEAINLVEDQLRHHPRERVTFLLNLAEHFKGDGAERFLTNRALNGALTAATQVKNFWGNRENNHYLRALMCETIFIAAANLAHPDYAPRILERAHRIFSGAYSCLKDETNMAQLLPVFERMNLKLTTWKSSVKG